MEFVLKLFMGTFIRISCSSLADKCRDKYHITLLACFNTNQTRLVIIIA